MPEDPHIIPHQEKVEAVIEKELQEYEAARHPERGISAYEHALDNNFVGTEEQWLASLVGETGAAGPAGPAGPWGTFSASAAELADIANAINTTDKLEGKQVWDSTNHIPMFAGGAAAGDHWFTIEGVDTITPV